MYSATRSLNPFMFPALLAVVIVGYLAGHHHVSVVPAETTQAASETGIELKYPSSWHQVAAAPTIPGLPLARPLLLAPDGNAAGAGLLSGQFPADQTSPLPLRFLTLIRGTPHVQVVNLSGGQAYRYSGLSLPGYDRALDLYVVPNPEESPTALACYASKGSTASMSSCEQIVATFTPKGRWAYDLTPSATYARRLGGLIGGLNANRLTLRGKMGPSAAPATVGNLANTLAGRFASAAASVAVLKPPLVAGSAQVMLAASLLQAHNAYQSLATTAAARDLVGYANARKQVDSAENSVDAALEWVALLGYGHT